MQYLDYLGLARLKPHDFDLLVFTGCSGSGKSSAIAYICERHACYAEAGLLSSRVEPLYRQGQIRSNLPRYLVLDELLEFRDLLLVRHLLRKGHRLLLASHLKEQWLKLLTIGYRSRFYATDQGVSHLADYLQLKGISASQRVLQDFQRRFGANFTDMRIIIERYPDKNFDRAYHYFSKFCHCRLD